MSHLNVPPCSEPCWCPWTCLPTSIGLSPSTAVLSLCQDPSKHHLPPNVVLPSAGWRCRGRRECWASPAFTSPVLRPLLSQGCCHSSPATVCEGRGPWSSCALTPRSLWAGKGKARFPRETSKRQCKMGQPQGPWLPRPHHVTSPTFQTNLCSLLVSWFQRAASPPRNLIHFPQRWGKKAPLLKIAHLALLCWLFPWQPTPSQEFQVRGSRPWCGCPVAPQLQPATEGFRETPE